MMRELPVPAPGPDEVLVRVRASAVNDWDWSAVRGRPYPYRLFLGLHRPKVKVLGAELAGVVEAVGPSVTRFAPGDRVYGDVSEAGLGGFAEFAAVPERALVAMPVGMSFIEAAALPHALMLAWQGLVGMGRLRAGERVLINGAGGGVGTLGVQIAKWSDTHVTGVDRGTKLELLRAAGYDDVIDFQQEDFTRTGQRYDLILDTKTARPPSAYLRALAPGGRYVTVGGELGRLLQIAMMGPLARRRTGKRLQVLALRPNEGLEAVHAHYEEGRLRPFIDGPYPLERVPWAIERFGAAEHLGKIVIEVR